MTSGLLIHARYQIVKEIGQTQFGKIFLALDQNQNPPIACVLTQIYPYNQTHVSKALQLQELGKHPQIPALLEYFEQEQKFYLVQELIEGTNLAIVLKEMGAFDEAQIWTLLYDLLPVLKFIHDCQIIHRNIKPENLIRRQGGQRLVLVDFAAAKLLTTIESDQNETQIGSPEYIAPEQARGEAVYASDLYSLGVTCIHLLTDIPPLELFDAVNDCWVWQDYLTQNLSNSLSQILDQLIQPKLSHRFQSAAEVMAALNLDSRYSRHLVKLPKPQTQTSPWSCLGTLTEQSGTFSINAVAISPSGSIIASGGDDKTIKLWHLEPELTNFPTATLFGHLQPVNSLAFSPDGKILATASDDQTIKLWNVGTQEELCTLSGHTRAVKSVSFSSDWLLASGSWDKTIKLWNVRTGTVIASLTGHQLQVTAVAFSPQGQLLASASFDRTIRLWQIPPIEVLETAPLENLIKNRPSSILSGHTRGVLTVAFSPDGNILATGSDDRTIKLWDLNTGQAIRTLLGHSWAVTAIAFSANGATLISGSWDKSVKIWQLSTGAEIATLWGHVDSVSAIAISPNGDIIASASKDRTIKLWQVQPS